MSLTRSQEFVRLATAHGLIFPLFHRHVSYMLESRFRTRWDRIAFNALTSYAGVLDWLEDEGLVGLGGGGAAPRGGGAGEGIVRSL